MNNAIWMGTLIGIAAAGGAGLEYRMTPPAYVEVVHVTPLIAPLERPRDGILVADGADRTQWYNVEYRVGAQTGFVRMDHDPGDRIPVRNGRMAVSATRTIGVAAR